MEQNFIYITFIDFNWQKSWVILCDNEGNPITDIKQAKKQAHINFPNVYWGLADKGQMLMGNAMQDNI